MQIYLTTTNNQDRLTFLNDLFQAPPLTHTDSILFPNEPYTPSQTPASRVESRQSLLSESDQMDLTNTGDQPPPLVDQPIDQASAVPYGISYPHVEAFELTEEFVEDHINNTI